MFTASMTFDLGEDVAALRELVHRWAQDRVRPMAAAIDRANAFPAELWREMGELGLLGMLVPDEWGGIGMSTVGFVAALEELGHADQSVAAAFQAHVTIGSMPLFLFGNDEQRERWLRPLAEGRVLGAFGLTEPDAGSDTRGIATRAVKQDGGWLINGRKAFISNAGTDMSFGVTLLARTDSPEDGGARFGSFVVEKGTAGFTMGPKMRGIGWKGLDTRELFFDDVWVADDHLVGDPKLGLGQFLGALEVGRISIAALSLSLTQAVLDLSIEYAKQRRQFGKPISDFQAIQFKLADMATELEAARWLTYRAAYLRDAGLPFLKEASMAKLKASRLAAAAASEAVQIHGGVGYMLESPVARFYCDSKVLEIGEGTNEIQHVVIARQLGC
jgi:short/branched chain acyl-CoA dehydrogenase